MCADPAVRSRDDVHHAIKPPLARLPLCTATRNPWLDFVENGAAKGVLLKFGRTEDGLVELPGTRVFHPCLKTGDSVREPSGLGSRSDVIERKDGRFRLEAMASNPRGE